MNEAVAACGGQPIIGPIISRVNWLYIHAIGNVQAVEWLYICSIYYMVDDYQTDQYFVEVTPCNP